MGLTRNKKKRTIIKNISLFSCVYQLFCLSLSYQIKTINIMKTKEILNHIEENGGFCNLNHWNKKEIAEYIYSNFPCSRYVAKNVAFNLL